VCLKRVLLSTKKTKKKNKSGRRGNRKSVCCWINLEEDYSASALEEKGTACAKESKSASRGGVGS